MEQNAELQLAWEFVEKTDRNIFLTGKAGTGKTTFLHRVRNESLKRLVVVAPTGVAAINAKGVTVHSFFQIAFGPILPSESGYNENSPSQKKFNKRKIDIIRSLDLLIIDEISMVRADLLDGIDQVLRKYKDKNKVFGGVQLLMIGDLQQLSPVVKNSDWQILQEYYETAYFFSSKSFQQANPIEIELKHIFRQKDKIFIDILGEIRNNRLSNNSLQILNKRYEPDFKPKKEDGYITLTTHNNSANEINELKLNNLKNKSISFTAKIEGDFPENAYPNAYKLELKVGSQVMFIKNDSQPEKRFFNGKIGEVISIEDEEVTVRCPGDESDISCGKEVWHNVAYSIEKETKQIKETIKGAFAQIPLKLAWAITIHKSQGLTFDKAIIDAKASFAHGQSYVAFSRCRTLEGMVLKTPIDSNCIIQDRSVISYTKEIENKGINDKILHQSQKQYQLNLLQELFSYQQMIFPLKKCLKTYYNNKTSIEGNILEKLKTILEKGVDEIIKVANSFHFQLTQLSKEIAEPEKNTIIQERIQKAIPYFVKHTEDFLVVPFSEIAYSTDSKEIEKSLKDALKEIEEKIEIKIFCFNGLKEGFNTTKYLELRAKSVLQKATTKKIKKRQIDISSRPELFEELRQLRNIFAQEEDVAHYKIFTQKSLYEICEILPTTEKQLRNISGMGKVRVKKYGTEILEVVKEYCDGNNINENFEVQKEIEVEKPKKKESTKEITFQMFKNGMNTKDIARERGLTPTTIEGHFAHLISMKKIKIDDIMSKEKANELIKTIEKTTFEGIKDLKEQINDKFTYGEIRMGLNHLMNNK
jgi:DNA-directed RNA polymerase subunit F